MPIDPRHTTLLNARPRPAALPGGITAQPLRDDADFLRVRSLLVATLPRTAPGWNWDVRRWDGQRYYNADPRLPAHWATHTQLWCTAEGAPIAAVFPEGDSLGEAWLQLDPDYLDLLDEMLAWAEANLAAPTQPSSGATTHSLSLYLHDYDAARISLALAHGYTQLEQGGVLRHTHLGRRLPPLRPLPPGYTLRTTRPADPTDCQAIANLLNAAFGREFHNALEYQNFARRAPSFVPDLDLVAVAPDGTLAAYVGIPYDAANRRAIFEPVCTHPDHRRRGLAQTLMLDGLHRLQRLGAATVTVETGDQLAANRLYATLGFIEAHRGHIWHKSFP